MNTGKIPRHGNGKNVKLLNASVIFCMKCCLRRIGKQNKNKSLLAHFDILNWFDKRNLLAEQDNSYCQKVVCQQVSRYIFSPHRVCTLAKCTWTTQAQQVIFCAILSAMTCQKTRQTNNQKSRHFWKMQSLTLASIFITETMTLSSLLPCQP